MMKPLPKELDGSRRKFVSNSSAALVLKQVTKLGGVWITPIVASVYLPAHAQTTEVEDNESASVDCPTDTSPDVIVTAGDIQQYFEGDQEWGAPVGAVPIGHVAFNMMPSVSGTLPTDTIFWEYSLDDGNNFSDVANLLITNGDTVVDQETSGTGAGSVSIPDTENQSGTIFRVTITRIGCDSDIIRGLTYQIVGTEIYMGGTVPQFATAWDINYTSLDANLDPMGPSVSLPTFSA